MGRLTAGVCSVYGVCVLVYVVCVRVCAVCRELPPSSVQRPRLRDVRVRNPDLDSGPSPDTGLPLPWSHPSSLLLLPHPGLIAERYHGCLLDSEHSQFRLSFPDAVCRSYPIRDLTDTGLCPGWT